MNYNGSQSDKAVPAGELDRSHLGHTVAFQANEFTVVFGKIAGIAKTDAMVYLSLDGVGGGTHLKDEFDLPINQDVYLQMDPLSSAEKNLSEAGRLIKDKLDDLVKNRREREQRSDSE